MRSLRWLTLTRVLLPPDPYKGQLPEHEHKGLERGSIFAGLISDFVQAYKPFHQQWAVETTDDINEHPHLYIQYVCVCIYIYVYVYIYIYTFH